MGRGVAGYEIQDIANGRRASGFKKLRHLKPNVMQRLLYPQRPLRTPGCAVTAQGGEPGKIVQWQTFTIDLPRPKGKVYCRVVHEETRDLGLSIAVDSMLFRRT